MIFSLIYSPTLRKIDLNRESERSGSKIGSWLITISQGARSLRAFIAAALALGKASSGGRNP